MTATAKNTRSRRRRKGLPPGRLPKVDREHQLLDTLDRMIQHFTYSPTLRELAKEMNVSLTWVAKLMDSCEQKGLVSRTRNIARSWRVIRPAAEGGAR